MPSMPWSPLLPICWTTILPRPAISHCNYQIDYKTFKEGWAVLPKRSRRFRHGAALDCCKACRGREGVSRLKACKQLPLLRTALTAHRGEAW